MLSLELRAALGISFLLVTSCGPSSTISDSRGNAGAAEGAKAGAASSGAAGTGATSGDGGRGSGGHAAAGAGGALGGGGGATGGGAGESGRGNGATGNGGNGATGGGAGVAGNAGSSAGSSSGGSSGDGASGDGGSAGERAIECTAAMPYFPDFDRSCTGDGDCVAVAHQTSCCGSELVIGIRSSEEAAFNAAEATCDQQYPACGCAAQGVDVEDGTQVTFAWQAQVQVSCDAGSCKAHYAGSSFACGARRCTDQQYCTVSSGGPIGTPTSYACNPTACTDCSCITMTSCSCSEVDGHLTVTCEYA